MDGSPVKMKEREVCEFLPDQGREDVCLSRHQVLEDLASVGTFVLVALQVEPPSHHVSPTVCRLSNFLQIRNFH